MDKKQTGTDRPCRLFFCYSGDTAAFVASSVKDVMESDHSHEYGNIWLSEQVGNGNYLHEISDLLKETEWVVFFVAESFTGRFLNEEKKRNPGVITADEMVAIEKERQARKAAGQQLKMLSVNIQEHCFDRACASDLDLLFLREEILQEDSVTAYTCLHRMPFLRSTRPSEFVEKWIAPICAMEVPVSKMEQSAQNQALSKPLLQQQDNNSQSDTFSQKHGALGERKGPIMLANGNFEFGHYQQTAHGKPEPIEWLPLKWNGNKALLLSKYALEVKRYDVWKPSVWADCTLQKWLNTEFLNEAFSCWEQKCILQTPIVTEYNPDYMTLPGKSLPCKVFLLSIQEAETLFQSDEARRGVTTNYGENKGSYKNSNYLINHLPTCWWWLRSPGYDSFHAAVVTTSGSVSRKGYGIDSVSGCVRPAIWVDLSDSV